MTPEQAHHIFGLLVAANPTVKVGEATTRIYTQAMAEFEYDDGIAGLGIVLDRARFWPTIGFVREAMREARAKRYAAMPSLPPPEEPLTDEQRNWARAEFERRGGLIWGGRHDS